VRAVVFDWAGTVVDFGSRAPAMTFVETFSAQGVPVTEAEARAPMGLPKRDHIRTMGMMARVAEAWREIHGSAFDESAVDRLYEAFTPRQVMAVRAHADVIAGVVSAVDALRRREIRIGSTTGYPRIVMAAITDLVASQGFVPDAMVCADDLPVTRPTPLGMWRCLIELGVWPAWSAVKVDDTVPGLLEGRDAGAWTVGILASGNAAGLTHAEWDALDDRGRQEVRDRSSAALARARPDFTIDTVADLLPVIDEIGHRLWCGERPGG
jgi:phosphonoacetaldehyde hydrolase